MSGPPYPPAPLPGSNAIGYFAIGVSPIGDISDFDVWSTFQSEYANSPRIDGLALSFAGTLDLTEELDEFFDLMWNVETAVGYGLDVWGRIVGASRYIHLTSGGPYLGFAEADDPANEQPFNVGVFYSGGTLTSNYRLSDAAYRLCIYAKALTNIWDGSVPKLNEILLTLFPGRGDCYAVDGENMTMTYTFNFPMTPVEQNVVQATNVLPRPNGVAVSFAFNP